MRRPGIFLSGQTLTRVHAALLVSRNITDEIRPSHVQLRISQSRRPLLVGIASFDSLAASEILHNSNHFTYQIFIPVKVFSQINNRIARDENECCDVIQDPLGRSSFISHAAASGWGGGGGSRSNHSILLYPSLTSTASASNETFAPASRSNCPRSDTRSMNSSTSSCALSKPM